jgi:hypothetical protein
LAVAVGAERQRWEVDDVCRPQICTREVTIRPKP